MDPVSALGLASAILAFVDFGTKVFRGTKKLYDSHSDALEENASSEVIASHMQRFSAELSTPDPANSTLTGNDAQLCELASECKKIADELIQLLEGLKRTDPKSWTQALRVAWKNEAQRSRKEDLNKRLESCRSQFQLQLNYYTSKETMTRLGALLERSKDNNIQMQKLQECVVRLQDTLQKGCDLNETAKHQVEELLRLPKETLAGIAQEKVLGGIRFSEIDRRFNDVQPAHSETFNWLFSDEKSTSEELLLAECFANHDEYQKEQEERDINRKTFAQWLSSGDGVFHFSAKLGAGKSTLMKEACKHDFVKARLREWADSHELVIGHFFFWKPGGTYQKTLDGMLRGLLHHVLRSQPRLIPLLLPSHWNEALSTPWQAGKDVEISDEDVRTSFERLISATSNSATLRLFLFIDGLDEMEENTTHTYQDLVETINEWVIKSSGNVKVCVSSREYSVFLNGFPESQRLHLHHLTRLDMQCYVRSRLRGIPNADDVDVLSNNIVNKAQGIFFWVTLVAKNIRQQLGDGASMDELSDQIDGLPDGLYELFKHVLMSLETNVRKISYETFAMMEEGISWKIPVPAIGYAFFRDWKKSQPPDYALTHIMAENNPTTLMLERSRMEVRRYCKGLVEISGRGYSSELAFAHRSVRDFLLEPSTAKAMEASNTHFDVYGALSQIALLADYLHIQNRLFMQEEEEKEEEGASRIAAARLVSDIQEWPNKLGNVLWMRQELNLDTEPYALLRTADTVDWPMVKKCWNRDRSIASRFGEDTEPFFCVPLGERLEVGSHVFTYCFTRGTYPPILVNSPMMILTQIGRPEYAVWQARNCPELKQDDLRISLLICCALSFHVGQTLEFSPLNTARDPWSPRTGSEIIRALLDEKLVSPNFPMPCAFYPLMKQAPDQDSLPSLLQVVFMATAMVVGDQNTDWAGSIIENLLQHTAVLDFTISRQQEVLCLKQTDTQTGKQTEWDFEFQSDGYRFAYAEGIQDWGPERIVEACGFENEDRILSLIRAQTGQTDPLLEENPPSTPEPAKHPPAPFGDESNKNVLPSQAGGTWGWLILMVIGMVLGTMLSKMFAR